MASLPIHDLACDCADCANDIAEPHPRWGYMLAGFLVGFAIIVAIEIVRAWLGLAR